MTDILIIMNNYFHDVATAVLLSAAVIMWALMKQAEKGDPADMRTLKRLYPRLTRFAQIALVWIIIGGIPRVIFFNTHDLGAIFDDIAAAIIVKHVFEVAAVLAGVLLWRSVRRKIQAAASAD